MKTQPHYYTFIKIWQDSETILAISNFDSHLEVDKITYSPNKTMSVDTIQSNSSLNPTSTTLTFIPTQSEKASIVKNKNLLIQVLCMKIDGNNQTAKLVLKRGSIGDIGIEGSKMILEIKSIAEALTNKINHRYSSTCRANFGDSQCKIDLEKYTIKKILVKGVIGSTIFIDMQTAEIPEKLSKLDKKTFELRAADADIKNGTKIGKVFKLSGDELIIEKHSTNSKITAGDMLEITLRCNNSYKSCHQIFQNNKNFRGEPQMSSNNI